MTVDFINFLKNRGLKTGDKVKIKSGPYRNEFTTVKKILRKKERIVLDVLKADGKYKQRFYTIHYSNL